LGSLAIRLADGKVANRGFVIDNQGEVRARYDKIHLFDVDLPTGESWRESAVYAGGREAVVVDGTPVGRLGLTICYDLRFPELYRILAVRGARLIAIPSAFTSTTGRDHWEVLLRARAIENQVFVLAPGQVGEAPPHHDSFGRSSIVDPWGVVLATAPDQECFVVADLDLAAQDRLRASLPSLANRRPEAYAWPQPAEASS
jgi:predicted amidohydrolase